MSVGDLVVTFHVPELLGPSSPPRYLCLKVGRPSRMLNLGWQSAHNQGCRLVAWSKASEQSSTIILVVSFCSIEEWTPASSCGPRRVSQRMSNFIALLSLQVM